MPRIAFPLILVFSVAGCSHSEEQPIEPGNIPATVGSAQDNGHTPSPAESNQRESPKPLCKRFSQYTVKGADLNKSVSPCDLYFYADDAMHGLLGNEKYFRVIIRRGKPVQLSEGGATRAEPVAWGDQLQPYWYKWTILDDKGKTIRSWLAHFLKNRDGNYHTVVDLPPDEWNRSILEVYFEDVDGDEVPEHVTFKLMVGDILRTQKQFPIFR
jgi:hypothetical protein